MYKKRYIHGNLPFGLYDYCNTVLAGEKASKAENDEGSGKLKACLPDACPVVLMLTMIALMLKAQSVQDPGFELQTPGIQISRSVVASRRSGPA